MTLPPNWNPGDGPNLPNGEEWIYWDILMGKSAASLADYLEAGNIPSAALCSELASFIRLGRLVALPSKSEETTEFARAKDARDRRLGAWLWARRLCIAGETLESAIAEATTVRAWPVSAGTLRRASASFMRQMLGSDLEETFYGRIAIRVAVLQVCGEAGLDRDEMLSRIEPVQKFRTFLASGK